MRPVCTLWQQGYELEAEIAAFTVGQDYLLDQRLVRAECQGSMPDVCMLAQIGVWSAAEKYSLLAERRAIIADAAISHDECRTWAHARTISNPGCQVS